MGGGTFNFGPVVLPRGFLPALFSTFCVLLCSLLSLLFPYSKRLKFQRRLNSLSSRPYIEKLTGYEVDDVPFAEVR